MDRERRSVPDRRRTTRSGRRAADRRASDDRIDSERRPGSVTVLLIDDRKETSELYGVGLTSAGYHVVAAESGDDGVRLAREVEPDVIVLDLPLRDGHGWRICDELAVVCGHIPVIVLTAEVRPDRGNRERARATPNCAAFVGKPCDTDQLVAVIERVRGGDRGIEITSGVLGR